MLASPVALLATSWQLYRANASAFIGYSAWLLLPLAVLLILATLPQHWFVFALAIFTTMAEIFIALWAGICIMRLTDELAQKKSTDHARLSRESAMRIPIVLMTAFLQALCVLGGLLLVIVPGFIFWVWYCFAQTIAAIEGTRPVESLTASRLLVRGRFFTVLWRILAGPLIIGLAYMFMLSLIVAVVSIALGLDPTTMVTQEPPIWLASLESVGEVLLMPLLLIYIVSLYQDLKTHPYETPAGHRA